MYNTRTSTTVECCLINLRMEPKYFQSVHSEVIGLEVLFDSARMKGLVAHYSIGRNIERRVDYYNERREFALETLQVLQRVVELYVVVSAGLGRQNGCINQI